MAYTRSPLRARVEEVSQPILQRMHSWPRWSTFVILLVLAIGGAVLPVPWAVICLLVLVALLVWLLYLGWPVLDPRARLPRLLVVGALFGAAIVRAFTG